MSTTQRVQCCFRCCVLHWLGALGLDENARHWHRIAKSFTVSSGTGAIEASEARAPALGATPQFTSPPPLESVLFFRFSMARFAHVQAVSLADWKALPGADAATLRGARFSTPSAARARNALVVLNGYGHILGSRRAAVLNISRAAVAGADADDGAIVHATAPPDHERVIFADPLPRLVRDVLPAGGAHAFLYGGDKSIERALLEKYASELGSGLKRFLAPNLAPAAARLPYATAVPLGLNRNARHLLQPHSHTSRADAPGRAATLPRTSSLAGGLLDEHTGALGQRQARRHGRRAQLLCCCMRTYEHRLAVASALNRSGFDCGQLSRGSLGSWEATMEQYARHRLVVAIHGRGNQDLHRPVIDSRGSRLWEILLAGAVPVMEHFSEQDALLEGLPVVRVRDWASLTPRWLHEEWERIQRGTSEGRLTWTKLYLPYWLHAFTAHIRPDLA